MLDNIGIRIKALRQALDLTQEQFASQIGLSRNYIAMIEIGQRDPSKRSISDICRVFGVDLIWLRTGAGEMFKPRTREEELAEIFALSISGLPILRRKRSSSKRIMKRIH